MPLKLKIAYVPNWIVPTADISTTPNYDGSYSLVGDWDTIVPSILFEEKLITYPAK